MIHWRKIEPEDLPFLYQWENDAAAWADGVNHNPLSQQDLRDYIASTTGDIYKDGQLRLILMNDSTTIGCVDLYDLDARNRRAAIGVYLAPEFRGQGWAREAMKLVEDYAFSFLQLHTIYAFVAEKNTASRALFLGQQFIPSSPLKDWTLEGDAILYIKNHADRI